MRTVVCKLSGVGCLSLMAACAGPPRTSHTPFEGTWIPNVAESQLPPGQQIPRDMRAIVKDDGNYLQTTQTFTGGLGRKATYVWNAACDGRMTEVQGVEPAGFVSMSCERQADGSIVDRLTDKSGYRHVETCSITPDGRKQICKGVARMPDQTEHPFVYVFDRE
jgi:hypothetical protein